MVAYKKNKKKQFGSTLEADWNNHLEFFLLN